eukprot:2054327-Prymnesium_polylepis.1
MSTFLVAFAGCFLLAIGCLCYHGRFGEHMARLSVSFRKHRAHRQDARSPWHYNPSSAATLACSVHGGAVPSTRVAIAPPLVVAGGLGATSSEVGEEAAQSGVSMLDGRRPRKAPQQGASASVVTVGVLIETAQEFEREATGRGRPPPRRARKRSKSFDLARAAHAQHSCAEKGLPPRRARQRSKSFDLPPRNQPSPHRVSPPATPPSTRSSPATSPAARATAHSRRTRGYASPATGGALRMRTPYAEEQSATDGWLAYSKSNFSPKGDCFRERDRSPREHS